MSAMFKPRVVSICAAFLLGATCHAAVAADAISPPEIFTSGTTPPDFESLRVKGLNISLPGPQDTIDPDFAGIRSSLASLGIGYIGYSNNFFTTTCCPQSGAHSACRLRMDFARLKRQDEASPNCAAGLPPRFG